MTILNVTLLTQQSCTLCDDAKTILDRVRDEFDLDVEIIDLATTVGEELAQRNAIMFPPGLLLDGEPFSYGRLSEKKLRKELARRIGSRR